MADILALRAAWHDDQASLDEAQQVLDQLEDELANAQGDGLPPAAVAALRKQVVAQARVVHQRTTFRDEAQAAYQAAVLADPMHAADPALPLVLLPVRIETAYLPAATGGLDLVVRIYPDDIHVDSHEPALTPDEQAAGADYWNAVWGAGANAARLGAAWQRVLARLKPARAAWAVEALRPAVPRPPEETPPDQPQPQPPLPSVEQRPGPFNRPAHTTLLPAHWQVVGLRAEAELFNVDGLPIPPTLELSFGPPGGDAGANDLPFGAGSRWLVDLDAAIAAGMALRIPMNGPDLSVDQLFVIGVNAATPPAEAAQRLGAALTAHQFTRGLAFVPPGTPTNNTSATRSAWQSAALPPTPGEVEAARFAFQPASLQNAALAASTFGIDGQAMLCSASHALDDQRTPLQVMQRQLWPALGAKALSMLYWQWDIPPGQSPSAGGWHLHDNPAASAVLAEHSTDWVQSRGPLPSLRIGNQPYGVLPVSSLADWVPGDGEASALLLPWLRALRPYWLAGVGDVPHVVAGATADPDSTVTNILQRQPVCDSVMLRADGDPVTPAIANQPFPMAPIPGLPMVSELFYAAPQADARPLPVALVGDSAGDRRLLLDYQSLFVDSLAVLTRTLPWADWSAKYEAVFGANRFPDAPPPDLFTTLVADSFTDPLAASGDQVAAGLLFGALVFNDKQNDPDYQRQVAALLPKAQVFVDDYAALCALGQPALYEPLLREALDVFSHRYDAWVTSLAARRLAQMRTAKPTGVVIGAYGWVEKLAPRDDLVAVNPPPAGLDAAWASPKQHYIHAPSLHHAATAAVLRAGFDSHAQAQTLAVDLRSERVRLADWLAAGVRNGQTLGALLGYRFERGLHDASLDDLIEALRLAHPLPMTAGTEGDVNDAAAREAIAARNVVDGLDLYRQRDAVRAQYAAQAQVGVLLDGLVDAVDALGDLLLAESVHHLVGGNPLRAGLSADTVGRGEAVPERFEVVRTPRSGRSLNWQLGALLPAAWRAAAAGWNDARPRAALEPHAEAWLRSVLGDATAWRLVCQVSDAAGGVTQVTTGLDALGLAALDVVAEASGAPSLLERRLVDAVAATQPPGSTVTPADDGSSAAPGLRALLALSKRLSSLLANASPIGPVQLQGPDASATLGLDAAELGGRVAAFQSSLANAAAGLDSAAQALRGALGAGNTGALDVALAATRAALIAIADHGTAAAYPPPAADPLSAASAIAAQADAVLARVRPLVQAPVPLLPPGADAPATQAWLGAVTEVARNLVGLTLPLLPTYRLPAGSPAALALTPSALPLQADAPALMAWLRRVTRVRANAAAVHDLLLAVESLVPGSPGLAATQLPVQSGARWVGLPFDDTAPPAARLASVWSMPAPVDATAGCCGLLFDSWTETLPGLRGVASRGSSYEAAEVTGAAFRLEVPDACAPQAILVAVAPDAAHGWSLDILLDVLQETLELAKLRGVDLGDLPRLGRVLPALHTGANVDSMIAATGVQP